MAVVFGPVPSRRLGRSLGVDPLRAKVCNLDCVYCQVGRTKGYAQRRVRFFPVQDILDETAAALALPACDDLDWITVVGSGEPTLYSELGALLAGLTTITDVPVAVITNGTTLGDPQVRRELALAAAVLPSLDAGSEAVFQRVNRPAPGLTLATHLDGLRQFRREYAGRLAVEVMLVAGLNDTEAALADIARALESIAPDEVHLSFPTRPPAEDWVRAPEAQGMARAARLLGGVARVVGAAQGHFDLSAADSAAQAVAAIVARHPMRESELMTALSDWADGEVHAALDDLHRQGRVQVVERLGHRFWVSAQARFDDRARR